MKLFLIFVAVICYISNGKGINAVNVTDIVSESHDLEDSLVLKAFDDLGLEELLDIADTNDQCREYIIQHYIIPKFHVDKQIIEIINYYPNDENIVITEDGTIEIYNAETALKFLCNFGHIISRIIIFHSHFHKELRIKISSFINEYCNESLREIKILQFNEDELLEWKKPFQHVDKVHLLAGRWNCEEVNINISYIFPSLRSLDMKWMLYTNSNCIDYHFPNLETIEFPMYADEYQIYHKVKMYENIFDLNPQLRSIHIQNMDEFDVLRVASEKLNNLERIELTELGGKVFESSYNETIRFKSVKLFNITIGSSHSNPNIIPIKFNQLEELWIQSWVPVEGKWIEFIGEQRRLKTLRLFYIFQDMSFRSWKIIVRNAPELEVIHTKWEPRYRDDGVAGIMAIGTNLKYVILDKLTNKHYDEMKKITGSEWRIEGMVRLPHNMVEWCLKDATFVRRQNYLLQ